METTRQDREKQAYDEGVVYEVSDNWHRRFQHVFECPNTRFHEEQYHQWILGLAPGKRVFDIGCGRGVLSKQIHDAGATYVLGMDISEHEVGIARKHEIPGVVDFAVGSVEDPIDGHFDVISGHSILHHIDYRTTLKRLYNDNLNPGGAMIFQEPLGSGLMIRAYTRLVPKGHTPDEQSFMKDDIRWFRENFPGVELHPFNYFSFAGGILSTKLFRSADNAMLRAAHKADVACGKLNFLLPYFRRCNIKITKPMA